MIKIKIRNTHKISIIIAIALISIIPFTITFSQDIDNTLQSLTLRQSYNIVLDPDEYVIHGVGYVSFTDHISYYCSLNDSEPLTIRAIRGSYLYLYPMQGSYEIITEYRISQVFEGNWLPRTPNDYYYFIFLNEYSSSITLNYSTSVTSDLPIIVTTMGISLGIIGAVAAVIT
ncbi:MAG: hypothetical protein ACFFDH_19630, partial [Promethearchaeota archaeon]